MSCQFQILPKMIKKGGTLGCGHLRGLPGLSGCDRNRSHTQPGFSPGDKARSNEPRCCSAETGWGYFQDLAIADL